jgi:hemerythrin-like metal-binding protein
MMCLICTKQLSVGNVVIDSEHRNLICLINNATRAIGTRDRFSLPQELEHLENWLCIHFANEERIAQAVSFPSARLRLAQQCSLDALRHLRDEMEAKYGMWSEGAAWHFSRLLEAWMIEHITKVDMPMKPMLQTHDYNFWPGWGGDGAGHTAMADCSLALAASGTAGCGCDSYPSASGKPAYPVFT